jgi:acyl-CoA synthetase (AMP-forming)/AMP-acid ligase II
VADFNTLVDLLRWRAHEHPVRLAMTWLEDGEQQEQHASYAQLDTRARAIAVALKEHVRPGDRVLLVYPAGLDTIAAFFGCLYAGAVAIPVYPPRPNRSLKRLGAIVEDAGAAAALTTAGVLAQMEARRADTPGLQTLPWLVTDTLGDDAVGDWRRPDLGPDSLAFLQYTSGSTGAPKGVMVPHGSLLANERMICESFGHEPQLLGLGWLPLYHDMGLIGNVLQPLFLGGRLVQMSPVAFLQKPRRWLEAISRYRATTSGAPNFAYDLCARRIPSEVRDTLDLSCWRVAYVGAEPIRAATLEHFAETFAPCGFRPSAFLGCYGLAEATLFVTGSKSPRRLKVDSAALEEARAVPAPAESEESQVLVSSGRPASDTHIVIVDPETGAPLPPGGIGEIWVRGPQVAQGYWGNPCATEETFHARLSSPDGGDGSGETFLRTGDLGVFHEGELFVTGRLKDLIIVDGRNYYPQDIEWTVERSHPALRPGGAAAFALERGEGEGVVVVQEVERSALRGDAEEIRRAIRAAVALEHDLPLLDMQMLRPGAVPRTSSGKLQRSLCRTLYLSGQLDLAFPPRPVLCAAAQQG